MIILLPTLGLTFWETRERKLDLMWSLWWLALVLLTHVLGYLIFRALGSRIHPSDA